MCVSGVKANDHIWWRRQWSSTIVTLILVAKHNLCHRLIDVIFLESKYPVMTKHRTHHTIPCYAMPCHSTGWTCLTDFNMLTAHLTTVLFTLNCWIDWSVCFYQSFNTFIKFCFNRVFFFMEKSDLCGTSSAIKDHKDTKPNGKWLTTYETMQMYRRIRLHSGWFIQLESFKFDGISSATLYIYCNSAGKLSSLHVYNQVFVSFYITNYSNTIGTSNWNVLAIFFSLDNFFLNNDRYFCSNSDENK